MSPLEIALIIIGIITIIISCLVVDRSVNTKNKTYSEAGTAADYITEQDIKLTSDKMEAMLSDISEEVIVRTDDALDKLSNEKIIAVNDFSEQILEKIRKNHEEVVFLYSMLEDKEKELKAAVREIDLTKKKLQEIMDIKSKTDKGQPLRTEKTNVVVNSQTGQQSIQTEALRKQLKTENTSSKVLSSQNVSDRLNKNDALLGMQDASNTLHTNNNQQILELYSQGKSVLEISKLLGLGQGEVKLVIDLFKGKK